MCGFSMEAKGDVIPCALLYKHLSQNQDSSDILGSTSFLKKGISIDTRS